MTFELKWIRERRKDPVGLSLLTVYVSLADLDPDLDLTLPPLSLLASTAPPLSRDQCSDLDVFVITYNIRLISYDTNVSLTSILCHVVDNVFLTSSL